MITTIHAIGGGKPIKAACAIRHKGYIISISTIAEPAEVLVYHEVTGDEVETYPATANGIAAAIEDVNYLIACKG